MIRTPCKGGEEEWDSPRFLKEHCRQMCTTIVLPACLVFGIIFVLIYVHVSNAIPCVKSLSSSSSFSLFRFVSRIVLLLLLLLLPLGKEEEV